MLRGSRSALLAAAAGFVVLVVVAWLAFGASRSAGAPARSSGSTINPADAVTPLLAPTAGNATGNSTPRLSLAASSTAGETPGAAPLPTALPDPAPPGEVDLHVPEASRRGSFWEPRRLSVPPGFEISLVAAGLGPARFMALSPAGDLFVSVPRSGRVLALPDRDHDGVADQVVTFADGLDNPHGLAWHDGYLYIANTASVVRARDDNQDLTADGVETVMPDLPHDGGHSTRTVVFGPDDKMYVSIGSSCNVCKERDSRRASIMRYNPDGSDEEQFARGLRNAVGIRWNPATGKLWASVNGRDYLGDDSPPEMITAVRAGDDFGWPRCHVGRIEDPDIGFPGSCQGVAVPNVEIQAHSAPLGLDFYTGDAFPPQYRGLFVALHGSWNRSTPVGNKVILIQLDPSGHGRAFDFVTGWLEQGRWGRPVDVLQAPDGSLLISDDDAGAIYRVRYVGTP